MPHRTPILACLLVALGTLGALPAAPADARPQATAKVSAKPAKANKPKGAAKKPVKSRGKPAKLSTARPTRDSASTATALASACRSKKAAKTAKCKALAAAQRKAEAQRKLAALCKQKAQRGTKACKALRAAQAKHRSHGSICGRRYGTAKKNEKVASFARRYKVAEARVRELNALAAATKKLKGGKRYVVFKSPHEGVVLTNGVLLEPLAGIVGLQRPQRGWGKPLLVDALRLAAEAVQRSAPLGTTLVMGDLSKQGGGCLPPHRSHRGGLDADIGLYFRGGHQRTWLGQATPDTLDADRTWLLLRVLLATGRLQYAFIDHGLQPALHEAALRAGESPDTLQAIIQWPRPIGEHGGAIVRHLGGHDDHLHVRLACPEGDPCALDDLGRARLGALQFDRQGGVAAEQVRSTRRSSRWVQGPGVAVPAALP